MYCLKMLINTDIMTILDYILKAFWGWWEYGWNSLQASANNSYSLLITRNYKILFTMQ